MNKSTPALRSAQQRLLHSLRRIEQISLGLDRNWWHVLLEVRQFEELHRDYRSMVNQYRDIYSDSHWTALLLFTAMRTNDRIVSQYVRTLRRGMHLAICDIGSIDTTTDARLLPHLSEFTEFTTTSLKMEMELLSQMLHILFASASRVPNRW